MIRIRRAAETDVPRITDIYNQGIRAHCTCDLQEISEAERLAWLQSHDDTTPVFVCEQAGYVVGYAYLTPYRSGREAVRRVAEVSYYFDFAYHRKGLGTALLHHMMECAKAIGYTHLLAILLSSNTPSIGLLTKHGFTQWGALPNIAVIGGVTHSHLYYGIKL